jgi:hypothetical protein
MAFTLNLIFRGLCIFVPNQNSSETMANSITVLLPDATAPIPTTNSYIHMPHIPLLKVNINNLDKESELKTTCWHILNDDLELRVNGNNLIESVDRGVTITNTRMDAESMEEFSFVPHMNRIYADHNPAGLAVKDECMDWAISPAKVGLASRIQLKGGQIGSYLHKEHVCYQEYKFASPSSNGTSYRQKGLADGVLFKLFVDADKLTIFSKQKSQGITLRPIEGEDSIKLDITNGMLKPRYEYLKLGEPDPDFELVYQVAKSVPQTDLRLPIRVTDPPRGYLPSPALCASAVFNSHSNG